MQRRNSQVYDGEDGPKGKQKKAELEDEAPKPTQAIIAEPAETKPSL
jgi:phospholipid-binding lipoprotein MlaA